MKCLIEGTVEFATRVLFVTAGRFGGSPHIAVAASTQARRGAHQGGAETPAREPSPWIGHFRQVDRERHQAGPIESRVDIREVVDRMYKQAGAGHEDHGQCDLGHHQTPAHVTACPRLPPLVLRFRERGCETVHADVPQVHQSEEHGGRRSDTTGNQQHRQIEAYFSRSRDSSGGIVCVSVRADLNERATTPWRCLRSTAVRLRS